jgi:hypothetical protein
MDGGAEAPSCTKTPQTTNGGSCSVFNVASPDAGEAGVPPVFCIEYTGSGQMPANTQVACMTMQGTFSTSPCATVAAGAMPVGFCIRDCATSQEYVQYYYDAPTTAQESQCQAIGGDVWVSP